MTSIFDCVVIGAGVSGMTSAIYLKRAGLNILLLEKSAPGGQINMSPNVENYPGFKNIEGATLAMNIFEQVENLDINYKYGNVLEILKETNIFNIKTDMEEYKTKTIIIATGRNVSKLNLDNEQDLIGRGISYCATCDANFYKEKEVCIYGNDYKTLEEAIYLSNICKYVNVICNNELFDCEKILLEKVDQIPNITIYYSSSITKLNVENQELKSIEINNKQKIETKGLFVSGNYKTNIDFIDQIDLIDGYIVTNEKMQTNIEGIYAVGDVIKKEVYQLSTAIGEATIAALNVNKYLKER